MSLLIAYLGVSKVNLAYERYMTAQISTGHALMILRELNQLALTLTENCSGEEADEWRSTTHQSIIQLIHETVATLRDGSHAALLARNVDRMNSNLGATAVTGLDDPMVLIHALRSHLYHDSMILSNKADEQLQLLERCKMVDLLHEFVMSYRNLLRIASTPLPFALVQMGRTFIFIWVVTIPFVLSGGDFLQQYPSAFSFVILLTYGFLGLEFVSRMLSNPFGDEIRNDLNIKGMGAAAIIGIENDSRSWKEDYGKKKQIRAARSDERGNSFSSISSRSLREFVQTRQKSIRNSGRFVHLDSVEDNQTNYLNMDYG
jgi:predicted membrane chloride channel (bestrophin family)